MPAAFFKHRPRYVAAPAKRPSSSARGYGTDWQKLRARAKKAMPYVCVDCGKHGDDSGPDGRLHLDHVKPRNQGGTDDPQNLRWRCVRCHSIKTARFDGAFGNPICTTSH